MLVRAQGYRSSLEGAAAGGLGEVVAQDGVPKACTSTSTSTSISTLESTRPNISASHSEISTRVPFCIAPPPPRHADRGRAAGYDVPRGTVAHPAQALPRSRGRRQRVSLPREQMRVLLRGRRPDAGGARPSPFSFPVSQHLLKRAAEGEGAQIWGVNLAERVPMVLTRRLKKCDEARGRH